VAGGRHHAPFGKNIERGPQRKRPNPGRYSASRTGRNLAPVSTGPREFADVMLVPFEMALRLGGARSVMPSDTPVVIGDPQ
jgi:hypothetical protein